MKNIDAIIRSWIDDKKLVQIWNRENPQDYSIAYVVNFDDNYLTLAEISTAGIYMGIIVCHLDEINSFETDSLYLAALSKSISVSNVYQQIEKHLSIVKNWTFNGILNDLKGSETLIGLIAINDTYAGRVIDVSGEVVILDKYECENNRCVGRVYLKTNDLIEINLYRPWLNVIQSALTEYNI